MATRARESRPPAYSFQVNGRRQLLGRTQLRDYALDVAASPGKLPLSQLTAERVRSARKGWTPRQPDRVIHARNGTGWTLADAPTCSSLVSNTDGSNPIGFDPLVRHKPLRGSGSRKPRASIAKLAPWVPDRQTSGGKQCPRSHSSRLMTSSRCSSPSKPTRGTAKISTPSVRDPPRPE